MSAINQTKPVPAGSGQPPRSPQGSLIQPKRPKSTRLLESCFVMKLEDFTMYMVSTPENKRTGHHKVFASDKKQLHLPSDMSVLHLEYTDYFFPEGLESPVPHANLYILLNPVRLMIDYLTLLWFNYFLLSLSKNVGQDMEGNNSPEHIDIKIEAVMPRVIVPAESKVEGQPDRPEYMQLQISRLCATNTRVEEKTTKEDLKSVLESYENVQLLKKKEFPNDSECQMIPKHFEAHVCDTDNPYIDKSVKNILSKASKGEIIVEGSEGAGEYSLITNTLKREAVCDIWCVVLDQVWLEFLGALNARTRPQPFVETFPASLWICAPSLSFRVPNQTPVTVVNANCTPTQSDHPNSTNDLHPVSNGVKDKRPDRLHIKQYYNCDVIDYTHSKGHNSTFCDSKKINSHECQGVGKKGERLQYRDNCLADFHVIAKVGAKIRIQLNHFQYLFMMRFSESVTKFQTQLQADFQRLGAEGSSSFCVPLIIPQIEFATVCPCLVHQKCFPDDLGSPVSPEDKQPDLPMEEKNFNAEEFPTIEFGEVSPLEGIDSDRGLPGDSHNSPNILITKSMSDSTIQSHSNGSIGHQSDTSTEYERNANVPLQRTSISALAISGHPDDRDSSISSGSLGVDSGISMDSRRGVLRNAKPQKGADMKKAISSAFSSFTDKLKIKSDGSEDTLSASDDLETMSVKTDLSSDEEFEHLNFDDLEAPVFCHDPPSETASTTDTYSDMADDLSSVYAESLSIRGKEIISIVLFKLDKTEVVIQSTGDQMTIGAQVASLSTCQPGNISSEDFHTKFSHSKGFIQDNTVAAGAPKVFPIKFLYTATSSPGSPDDIFMTIKAKDVSLSFKMSSLTSLADFIEDEKIPDPIPMSVDVRNLLLILEEDRPSVNPMSPGAVPVDLQIHKIMIRRGMDGVFHFSGGSMESAQGLESLQSLQGMENLSNSSDNISLKTGLTSMEMDTEKEDTPVPLLAPLRQLQTDNFKLKAQVQELLAMQKTNEKELKEMREALQLQKTDRDIEVENFKLQQRIVVLEEDLQISLKEKDSLLATLRLLQEDLMASEQRFRSRTTTS